MIYVLQGKFDKNQYKHPNEIYADCCLCFDNATQYNAVGTDVHRMAAMLRKSLEERLAVKESTTDRMSRSDFVLSAIVSRSCECFQRRSTESDLDGRLVALGGQLH